MEKGKNRIIGLAHLEKGVEAINRVVTHPTPSNNRSVEPQTLQGEEYARVIFFSY